VPGKGAICVGKSSQHRAEYISKEQRREDRTHGVRIGAGRVSRPSVTPVSRYTRVSFVIPNMRYTLPGVSACTKAPSHAVSVPATISSLAPPVSCIVTAAACVLGARSDSIRISANPPADASLRSSRRARTSQRHNDDGDRSFSRRKSAA
jgi:hypothetical protein